MYIYIYICIYIYIMCIYVINKGPSKKVTLTPPIDADFASWISWQISPSMRCFPSSACTTSPTSRRWVVHKCALSLCIYMIMYITYIYIYLNIIDKYHINACGKLLYICKYIIAHVYKYNIYNIVHMQIIVNNDVYVHMMVYVYIYINTRIYVCMYMHIQINWT